MAKTKTKKEEKIPDKKLNRLLIEQKLEEAFSDLKYFVGKKKYEQGIRKAGKMLNNGFSKKALDNFRSVKVAGGSVNEREGDMITLIEELP